MTRNGYPRVVFNFIDSVPEGVDGLNIDIRKVRKMLYVSNSFKILKKNYTDYYKNEI